MSHAIVIEGGTVDVSCSCGWKPAEWKSGDESDFQERQWEEHLRDQIRAIDWPNRYDQGPDSYVLERLVLALIG